MISLQKFNPVRRRKLSASYDHTNRKSFVAKTRTNFLRVFLVTIVIGGVGLLSSIIVTHVMSQGDNSSLHMEYSNNYQSSKDNPSSILNLTSWYLTLPTGSNKNPNEVKQPGLATFSENPYFYANSNGNGVVFQAPTNGVTTTNSQYPRSELREMTDGGKEKASWSTTSGTSTMAIREAITHLPTVRPEVVAGQVHGPSAYVALIRLNKSTLFVEHNGKNMGTLNSNYKLGTIFNVKIIASNGYIQVFYNGTKKADFANDGSGYYFKAGCYTQSNSNVGGSDDYGQVVIYDLQVTHD